jgi:hypothetical protein
MVRPMVTNKKRVVKTRKAKRTMVVPLKLKSRPPISFGMEPAKPKKETMPEAAETTAKAKILPKASSLLLIGVRSIAARVPLSFSPATASGQVDITVEKRSETVTIGKMKPMTLPAMKSLSETLASIGLKSLSTLT